MSSFKKRSRKYAELAAGSRGNTPLVGCKIDESLLNIFCAYAVSRNAHIHSHGLANLIKLTNNMDISIYANNERAMLKYDFLKAVLQTRISGITDRELLLSAANKSVDVQVVLSTNKNLLREINTEEVNYVESSVSEALNNMTIDNSVESVMNICKNYMDADFRARSTMVPQIRSTMSNILTQMRRNDVDKDTSDTLFRLTDMENSVRDIHRYVTAPSFKLISGMQGLNGMLGGGFEKGNVYSFFGLPGEGKTVTLENLLYQLWKYNRGYQCKDKTKKPCIVLLTMENFVRQTVCALYHIMTGGKNLRDCKTADEAIEEFRSHAFEFSMDDENSIEIVIKYKPVNSITTDYLYKLVEDLEDDGYECIAFLHDYVKRILPTLRTGDPYQDLGNVVNDFKTFATLKDIPFITASQLNREAAKLIDEGRNANRNDLIKKLGRSNIGESSRIDENLDGTFIITPEFSTDGKKYMGIKNTKHRYEIFTNKVSIYQPYINPDSIAFVEDVYETKPAYRESLMRDNEEIRASFGDIERASINKSVQSMSRLAGSMIRPGLTSTASRMVKKQEPMKDIPVGNIVKKVVMQYIPEENREQLREKFGISKMV